MTKPITKDGCIRPEVLIRQSLERIHRALATISRQVERIDPSLDPKYQEIFQIPILVAIVRVRKLTGVSIMGDSGGSPKPYKEKEA